MPTATGTEAAGEPWILGFLAIPPDVLLGHYGDDPVERVDEALRFAVVRTDDPLGLAARAAADPNVRYVLRDIAGAYAPDFAPLTSDPGASYQYALARVNATGAWSETSGDARVVVAVVDTGMDSAHEDLAGPRMLPGWDFSNGDAEPEDDCGHGTHVAGIVGAGKDNAYGGAGTAQVSLLPVKVMRMSAGTCGGSLSTIASGIRFAADRADIITMAFGCPPGCSDPATTDAIEYAWSKGAVLVGSAGNRGPCADCVSFPASHPKVIAVACTDRYDSVCAFSSSGPEVDVAAPGRMVYSTLPGDGYGNFSGTSMSAGHVAGAVALALSANASLTNERVRTLLDAAARDLGVAGVDEATGHGLLDIGALVAASGAGARPTGPTGVDLDLPVGARTVSRGSVGTYEIFVTNTGQAPDVVDLATSGSRHGWKVSLSATSVALAPGATAVVELTVKVPRSASPGSSLDVEVTGTSRTDPAVDDTVVARTSAA